MFIVLLIAAATIARSNAFLDPIFFSFGAESNCTHSEFSCLNSKCIPVSKRCDGHNDCLDLSDEQDCDIVHCTEDHLYKCKNGRCISKSFICDGENDCEDFSDEENCEGFKASMHLPQTCAHDEWQCTDKLCISKEWVCNGEQDCLDGSDETIGCSKNLECDAFKCKNNHCVPNEWRCDGNDDCHDNSDEENCENYINPKDCTLDAQKYLCANNKTCISLNEVCDGKNHCPDNSDESPLCKKPEMSCSNHNCSHNCVQMPLGPKCLCPKGYHNINEKMCEDINECETYGICDQKCRNTPGSYECYCDQKYFLQDDKSTCQASGGEAMMVFSSKTEIRAYLLTSELYFPVAKNLKHVVGVAFDGHHVYWTDISFEHESIVRAIEDGSQREVIVTSGLGSPEDLAVDWLTGNVYFSDAERQHIGVCGNNGKHCTVLVNKDIRKPRGIVLNVEEGEMFWTDWGTPAEIARSKMDGSEAMPFVSTNIHWPNGLTIDGPNERLYWTDAKFTTLESIKLDGTDRRIILEGVVKHPYAIAVFENKLYWSDWATHSIQSCDKFTGKNHTTIVKEKREYIYGISIFHSSLRKRADNPCALAFCSDICLLSGDSYSCACPEDKVLSADNHTCKENGKKQTLIIGAKNMLIHVEHQHLGKHEMKVMPSVVKNVGAFAYDSLNNTLYISDLGIKRVVALNLGTGVSNPLDLGPLGTITAMDYDYLGGNLYFADQERGTLETINLKTLSRKVLLHDMEGEIPESIALAPDYGVMFVALRKKHEKITHLDRLNMDGTSRSHVMETGLVGPVSLYFDSDLHRVLIADANTGVIESTSVEGDDRHAFRTLDTNPIGITSLKKDVFWVNENSKRINWGDKYSNTYNKKITLDLPENIEKLHIISVTPRKVQNHVCQHNNGNCSHLCLLSQKSAICACPSAMTLSSDNKTCVKTSHCDTTEFKCHLSNSCIPKHLACDGNHDCQHGEDEENCKPINHCPSGFFMCTSGDCILENKKCDFHYDCHDKSDEQDCQKTLAKSSCPPEHFRCSTGLCISNRFVCDGSPDCPDKADEANCLSSTCEETQFRCSSGSCIPKSWECDHEYDCPDLSDEHGECAAITCPPTTFTCTNGMCIDKAFLCDNSNDCGDNSDEMGCDDKNHCKPDQWACTSDPTKCIPLSGVCNGTAECPKREDEAKCSDCANDEFSCNNKKCINIAWTCDKNDDCGDNSDESETLCNHSKNITEIFEFNRPCTNGFRCKSGHCIDLSLVCNKQHDCYDGSDEDGFCSTACQANHNPCSHDCVKTPTGPMCKCRTGYELKGDGQTCSDIDECMLDPPVCSQLCHNQQGGFRCDCFDGFLLRTDKKSCKAQGAPMSMLFTSDNQIRELSQLENRLKLIYSEETPKITGLDVGVRSGDTYFSIENSGTLHFINIRNKTRGYINQLGQPKKLAVDWITSNIYYFNANSNAKSISVCHFEAKACAQVLPIDLHSQVSAIAVDAVNKYIFYSVTSWWVFNAPSYAIYRANLDGSGIVELQKSAVGFVAGLTYDLNKKHLYYVDQHLGEVARVNYDGSKKHTILNNLSKPMGLNFFENEIYYLSAGGFMNKCKLYDILACDSFKIDRYTGDIFAIGQDSKQPLGVDACANHSCSHLCVPNQVHYSCLCENGKMVGDNEECSQERFSENDGRLAHIVHTQKDAETQTSTGSIVAGILIPLILVAFGITCYYVARRRNSGKLNVSMRFYNPVYGLRSEDTSDQKPILVPGRHEYINPVDYHNDSDIEIITPNAVLRRMSSITVENLS